MKEFQVDVSTVDDFLADERRKLNEERRAVDLILTILKNEQQIFSDSLNDEGIQIELPNDDDDCDENTVKAVYSEQDDKEESVICIEASKKSKTYNSQVEKERLAYLFENAPSSLNFPITLRKHREYYRSGSVNGKNRACACSRSKVLALKYGTDQIVENINNGENMVRMGEYSPLNSAFHSSDRSLLGLGEYEGRRRAFLEKKKQEYVEYLSNMKKHKKLQRSRSKENKLEINEDDGYMSHSSENSPFRKGSRIFRKILTPDSDSIRDAAFSHCYTRMQREKYRKELDEQIREKEKLEKERKHREKLECQKNQCNDFKQRRDFMKRIEDDFNRRLKVLNDCKRKNDEAPPSTRNQNSSSSCTENKNDRTPSSMIHKQRSHKSNDPFAKQNIETCAVENVDAYEKMKKDLYKRELSKQIEEKHQIEKQHKRTEESVEQHQVDTESNSQIPHYLGNPFMKQSAESWTIDNLEEYRRMKDELYKRELDKQIEEKRKLEAERKAKAEESDRKLEAKLRKDEERKLKEEFERAEALKSYQESQNVMEDTNYVEKLHKSKKDSAALNFSHKSFNKARNVSSTDQKFNGKTTLKTVSFAPRTFIYSIDESGNSNHVSTSAKSTVSQNTSKFKKDSIIIEAPYKLAVKNISNSITINNDCGQKKSSSVSPVLQERVPITSDISELLPEVGNLPIPSAVSMSEQAFREYFKTRAFSDLSQIRRMLRERKAD